MNELEKALEQLNIKYETNGKQYKIPTTKENLVELLKGYMGMVEYLQSKIDKVNELLDKLEMQPAYLDCKYYELDGFNELRNILKEDK